MKDELIVTELNEIFEAFTEEMERKIQVKEFFCLILWSVKNISIEPYNYITATSVEEIRVVMKAQSLKINISEILDQLGELNDNCFVTTSDFISALIKENLQSDDYEITIKSVFHLIIIALHKFDTTPFEDYDKLEIQKVDIKFVSKKKIRIKQGDVITIPLSDTTFAIAIMIEKTSFGTGYGIFNKRYSSFSFKQLVSDEVLKYQLFTVDTPVQEGVWKIMFNDKNLLNRFPKTLEKFHSPLLFDSAKPYGLGETSDGTLRKLSKEEAEEIGILSKDFDQVLLPEELKDFLNELLPADT